MIKNVIELDKNNISPDCMQLVFEFTGFPALGELLDSLIIVLISWLETEGMDRLFAVDSSPRGCLLFHA